VCDADDSSVDLADRVPPNFSMLITFGVHMSQGIGKNANSECKIKTMLSPVRFRFSRIPCEFYFFHDDIPSPL